MTNTTLPAADVIDADQLRAMLRESPNTRILDVRTGGEFDSVHIPGAYNVPLDTLGEHVRDLADVEHPVVLVCKSGARAGQASAALSGAGKERLHILAGGMEAWEATGGEVRRGENQKWAMDRQVRLVAGSLSLLGIVSSVFVPKTKWLAGGVAAGLTYSAISNTCAMASVLAKLPYNKSDNCDIEGVLKQLRSPA